MSGNPTIRAAVVPDDIESIRRLFEEYARELGIDLAFQSFADEMAALPGAYTPPAGRLLVATEDQQLIGVVAMQDTGNGFCEMKRMVVVRDWRGRGIGRQLANAVAAEAREAGYRAMRLDTLARLEPANLLYRSMGFVEIPPYRPNPHSDAVFLELDLRDRG